jgi:exodeoxyribonuclease VII large subunit
MMNMDLPERKIYTVSELTQAIKDRLEEEYPSIWIQGEISNFRPAPSGHFYFTLKDEYSQIRCVMFKTQNRFLKFRPENGLEVIGWGRLSVYSPRGEYQIIFDTMEPLGFGSLMLAFEQLRDKLAAEGLFDDERKKVLPSFPRTIGLVTSRRGAAVRDMIRIASRRSPGTDVLLSSTSVQGEKAPDEIVAALDRICATGDVDVVIIGRGGGSMEDLWAFNDERVVRAVANCPMPIVSAVGHETDFTLTDFAADVRASTPSAAAEIVVPDRRGLSERIWHLLARSRGAVSATLQRCSTAIDEAVARLYDPRRNILERRQRLDDLTQRLSGAIRRKLAALREDAAACSNRLRPEHLRREISAGAEEREILVTRLIRSIHELTKDNRASVESLAARLEGLSPLAVLSRGYSVTFRPDTDEVLMDSTTIASGEDVRVRLHRGELDCRVTGTRTPRED